MGSSRSADLLLINHFLLSQHSKIMGTYKTTAGVGATGLPGQSPPSPTRKNIAATAVAFTGEPQQFHGSAFILHSFTEISLREQGGCFQGSMPLTFHARTSCGFGHVTSSPPHPRHLASASSLPRLPRRMPAASAVLRERTRLPGRMRRPPAEPTAAVAAELLSVSEAWRQTRDLGAPGLPSPEACPIFVASLLLAFSLRSSIPLLPLGAQPSPEETEMTEALGAKNR